MRPAFQAIILLLEGQEYWETKQGKAFKIKRPSYIVAGGTGAGLGAVGGYALGHVIRGPGGRHLGAVAGAAAGAGINAYKTHKKVKKLNQVLDAVKKFGGRKVDKKGYQAAQQRELEKRVSQI